MVGARLFCCEIRTSEQTAAVCQSAVHVQAVLTRKISRLSGKAGDCSPASPLGRGWPHSWHHNTSSRCCKRCLLSLLC